MIVTKTPFRISLLGGGTDLQYFYKIQPGSVVSFSINKYMYVNLNKSFADNFRIAYSEVEIVPELNLIKHNLVRSILKFLEVRQKLEIVSIADIPSNGSGLGSSSAFSVGLVHALNTFLHDSYVYSAVDVAETACKIEIDMNRSPIGKQDQYAVALGGLNQLVFNKDESVSISPINLDNYIETLLFDCILIFHTNLGRSTDRILSNTSQLSDKDKMSHLSEIKELTTKAKSIILNGEIDLLGKLVLENHKLKTLINENSKHVLFESVLNYLIQKGGYGGKILGAGGGGFGLLIGPPEVLEKVKSEYDKIQFHRVSLDKFGSQVMFNDN
jgi:D-glycero-alpha-D-manno-heptose-7-phosphate kinase